MVRVQSRSRKLSLPTRSTAILSAVPQSIGWDIQCTGVMSPSRRREQWGLPMREKGCWMTMEICVWTHQQGVKHWRKESTTTWLNWQLQWSTRHQGSRLWSCKPCPLQLDYCDGNNLYKGWNDHRRNDGYHIRDKSEQLKQTEHQQHTTLSRYYVVNVYEFTSTSLLNQED